MSRDFYNTDKIYGVPIEEIGCPGCGRKYGHHKTKVDLIHKNVLHVQKNQIIKM